MGPNTDPRGTPLVTGMKLDFFPLSTTSCVLSLKNPLSTVASPIPKEDKFESSVGWGTVSKAFWKSKYITSTE